MGDDNFQFFRPLPFVPAATAGNTRGLHACLRLRPGHEPSSQRHWSLPKYRSLLAGWPDLGLVDDCRRLTAGASWPPRVPRRRHRGCSSPRGALRDALLRTTRSMQISDSPSTSECLRQPAEVSECLPPTRSDSHPVKPSVDAVWILHNGPPNRLPSPRTRSLATGQRKPLPRAPRGRDGLRCAGVADPLAPLDAASIAGSSL